MESIASSWEWRRVAYAALAQFVLVLYDGILLFPSEIKYIWQKEWGFVTTMYLLARYSSIIGAAVGVSIYLQGLGDTFCFRYNTLVFLGFFGCTALAVACFASQGVLFATAYAFSNKNCYVLFSLGSLLLVLVTAQIGIWVNAVVGVNAVAGCADHGFLEIGPGGDIWMNIHLPASLSYNLIVLFTVYIYTARSHEYTNPIPLLPGRSLAELLANQVIARVLILCFASILNILWDNVGSKMSWSSLSLLFTPLAESVSAVLVCQFLLSIRKINHQPNRPSIGLDSMSSGAIRSAFRRFEENVIREIRSSFVQSDILVIGKKKAHEDFEAEYFA